MDEKRHRRFERRVERCLDNTQGPPRPPIPQSRDFQREGIRVAERRYAAKDTLFAPGDPGSQLYFLLDGTVRLYRIYGGYKEATVALLKNGGVFGELGLDEGSRQSVFAEALTGVTVAVVRKSILTEVIKRRPEFALKLFSPSPSASGSPTR
jgi:CRP/FNR family transcriptional regulator